MYSSLSLTVLCLGRLYGSYESLDGGELAEALEDFTGGVSEPLNLVDLKVGIEEEARNDLYKVMRKAMDNHAMMAAAIPVRIFSSIRSFQLWFSSECD